MNINENELREDLGPLGGAVKNGWLKPSFHVEEVIIDVYNGKPCLKCHMSRWFGRDDDIILLPDGTGINVDPNAKNDKTFKWKSIRALHTSFTKAILIGAGAGAAIGAGVGAVGGHLGWWGAAAKSAGSAAATGAEGAVATTATRTAVKGAGRQTAKRTATRGASNANKGKKAANAAGYSIVGGNQQTYNANSSIGGTVLTEEQINEVAHALVGGAIGAAGGAIAGGIYALIKNRDDIMYYSDGSYVSRKGTVEGRWDGSVEEEQRGNGGSGGNGSQRTTPRQTINVPGMPADFASNSENVKIAQRYLTANGANLSTAKSVDGVDGLLGPRTRRAILAYMNQYSCDFNKFWQDAQEYNQKKKNVDDMKTQNLQAQMQQVQNLKLNKPEIGNQQQVQTVNEVRAQFFDMLNRINNATILQ